MNVAVIGATGKTGQRVTAELLPPRALHHRLLIHSRKSKALATSGAVPVRSKSLETRR